MGVYGLHWTQLSHWYWYRYCGTLRYFTVLYSTLRYFTVLLRYFYGTLRCFYRIFWYFNLILKAVKEPSELEPERGAEAHEVRRSAEFTKIV